MQDKDFIVVFNCWWGYWARRCLRKINIKASAFTDPAFNVDVASELFQDRVDGRQTQAREIWCLIGVGNVEDAFECSRIHAGARVSNAEAGVTAFASAGMRRYEFCIEKNFFGSNGDAASGGHRIFAVNENAEEDLVDPKPVHIDLRQIFRGKEFDLDFAAEQTSGHGDGFGYRCIEVECPAACWLLSGILLKGVDELRHFS